MLPQDEGAWSGARAGGAPDARAYRVAAPEPRGTLMGLDARAFLAIGAVVVVVGIGLAILGITTMTSAPPMPEPTWDFDQAWRDSQQWFEESSRRGFTGWALGALGLVLIGLGGDMLALGMTRPMTRYYAAEASPGIEIASGAFARGVQSSGMTASAGPWPGSDRTLVRVRCRACGALEKEDAKFCSTCGRPM